jgi:hypothetical protein
MKYVGSTPSPAKPSSSFHEDISGTGKSRLVPGLHSFTMRPLGFLPRPKCAWMSAVEKLIPPLVGLTSFQETGSSEIRY